MKNIAHIKNHKLTISQLEKIKSMDDLTFKTSGLEEFSNKLTKKLLGRTNNVWRNFTLEYYDEQGSDELEKTNTIVNQKISFDVSLIIEGQSEEKGTSRNLEHQSINNQNTKEIYKSSKELSNYWNKVENTFLGNSYKKYNYNSLTKSSYNVPSLFLKNSSHISNNSNMNSYFETKNQNNIFRGFSQKKEMFESYQDQIFSSIENSIKNKVVSLTRNFLIRNFSFFDKTVFKTNSSKTDKINNWHIQKINEQSNMQLLNNKQNINNLFADNLIQYLNMQNSELSFDDNNEQSNHTINNLLRSSNIGESFNTIVNSIVKSYSNKFKTASQNISVLYKDENSATNNKLKKENKLNASPRIKIEQRQGLHSFHDGVKRVKDIETFAIESLQYLDDNTDQIDQQQSSEISSIITNLVSFVYKNVGEVTNIDSLVNSYVDRLSSSSQNISVLYNDSINYKMKNVQKGIFKNEYAITGLIQRAMPQSVNGQNDKVINDRLTNQITSTHQLIDSENKFRSIEMFARESLQYLDENKDQLGEQQTNEISGIINNLISSVNKSNSQTDLNTYVNTYVDRLSSTSRNISVLYNNENHSRINNVDGAFGVDGKGTRSAGQRASLNKAAQTSGQREDEQIASGRVISKLITNTQRISDRENSPRSIEMFARESLQYLDENKDQLGEQQTNEISGIINNLISSVNKSNSQTDLNTYVNTYVDRLSSTSRNISVLYNNENHSRINNVDGAFGVDGKGTRSAGQRASLNKAAQTSGQREDEQIASGRVISKLITNTQRISDRENSPRSIENVCTRKLAVFGRNKDQLGEQQTNEISGIINNLISSVNKSNSQTDLNTYVNTYVDRLSSTSRNISVLYNNENHSRISNVDGAVGVDGKETRSVGQRASLNKAAQTSGQREDEQIASGRVISKLITNTQRISDRENSPRSIEMFARESLQYLDENKDQLGEQQTNEISGIINNLISSVNKSNSQTDLNSYVNTYMDRLSVKSQNISALYNDNSSMHMNNVQKQSRSNALELPKIALSSIVQNMSRQEKSSGALRDQMVDMQGSVAQENSMRNIDLFARESLQYLDENKDQFGVQQASEMSSIINNLVNSVNRNDRSSHRQNDVNSIMHSYINKISRSSQNISVVNQAYQNSKARATQLIQKMGERLNSPTSSSANSISESDMRLQNIRVNTEKITNLYDESESMLNMSKIETYKYQSQNQLIHAQDNTSENGNNLSGFKTTNVDKVINLSNTNIKNMANKTINLIENMDKMTTLMTNSLDNNSVEQMPEKITLKMILDSAEKASSGKSTGGLKSMLSVPADIVMFAPPAYMTPYGVDPNALGKRPAEKASPNRLMPANQTRQTDSADGFGSLNKKAGNDIMNMANKARSHQWNSPNNYRYTPPDMVMKNNGNNDEKNAMSQMNNLKSINQEMKKNTKILAKASATELSANQMKSIVDTVYQKFEKRMSRELKKRG